MDLALQEVQKQFGKHYALVINGKSVAADEEFSSVNPARPNEIVGSIAAGNSVNVMEAVAAARVAFSRWNQTSFDERARYSQGRGSSPATPLRAGCLGGIQVGKTWQKPTPTSSKPSIFESFTPRKRAG